MMGGGAMSILHHRLAMADAGVALRGHVASDAVIFAARVEALMIRDGPTAIRRGCVFLHSNTK